MPWLRIGRRMPSMRLGQLRPAALGALGGMMLTFTVFHAVTPAPLDGAAPPEAGFTLADAGTPETAGAPPSLLTATAAGAPSTPAGDHQTAIQRVMSRFGLLLVPDEDSTGGTGPARLQAASQPAGAQMPGTQADGAQTAGRSHGTQAAAIQAAEAEVARAWTVLHEVRTEQERLLARPEVAELSRAQQRLAQADARLGRASAEVQRLAQPDPVLVEAAERSLWRAEATLHAARSLRPVHDTAFNPVDPAEEIRQADRAVAEARARREALRTGPSPETLAQAEAELTSAQAAREEAAARVQQLQQFVAVLPLEQVNAAAASAIAGLAEAEARLKALQTRQAQQTSPSFGR